MGIPEKNGLIQTIHPAQREFRRAIRQTAPVFVPFSRKQFKDRSLPPVKFLDNEEEAEAVLPPEEHDSELGGSESESDGEETKAKGTGSGVIYIDEVLTLANESVLLFPCILQG